MQRRVSQCPTLVDALARVMRKDRVASDTLSELTPLPELSEGTSPNANGNGSIDWWQYQPYALLIMVQVYRV